jgi:hypothetical protein
VATQPDPSVAPSSPQLPALSSPLPSIPLLGGATINAFVDVAGAPPTDGKLNFNLLVQLGPLFASMACLFKILNVMGAMQDFVKNPLNVPAGIKLGEAITAVLQCVPALQILSLIEMLKGIILTIVSFIDCVLEQVDSVLKFQASLDFQSAQGNPTLTNALTAAQNNANTALSNTMSSLQPLQPLMQVINMIASVAGQSLTLPSFSSVSSDASQIASTVDTLKNAVDSLKSIVQSLP